MTVNELNVEEGNKLIRDFAEHGYLSVKLNYHKDWNDLMPVVEKINEFMVGEKRFRVTIMPTQTMISVYAHAAMSVPMRELNFFVGGKSKMITATWECIVQFIQWYNKNKP